MRARSLKPGLFKNEILGSADPLLTILFEGLWCMADREGRLEDRPLRICAEVFPYRRNVTERRCDSMLGWLAEHGFIARYVANAQRCIQVLNFSEHQNPHSKERPSTIPALSSIEHQPSPVPEPGAAPPKPERAGLTPDSGLLTPSSGRKTHADPPASDPVRAATPGVIDFGRNLTRSAVEIAADDAWQDVEGIEREVFRRWIEISAERGKPLDARTRLANAKWLAGHPPADQREIVAQAERFGWKNLRPLERTADGKPRAAASAAARLSWRPGDSDA